jgi:hypothetical protein
MARTLLILIFAAWQAVAATYYIAPSGGSDSNPGTEAQPWETWTKVRNTIASGDTVIARGGIYSQQFWSGVGVKSNLTFLAYTNEVPIFANYSNYNSGATLFINGGWTNCVFDGFTWSNNHHHVNLNTASRLVFRNCKFGWWGPQSAAYGMINLWSSKWITFTNCEFRAWGTVAGGDDTGAPVQVGGFNPQYDSNCWGNVFVDCRFVYGGHDNLEVYTYSNVFRRCTFYNGNFFPNGGTNYGNRNVGILGTYSSRNLFDECVFADTGRPIDDDEVSGVELSSPYHIVRRSVFHNQAGPAMSPYTKGFGVGPSNIYYYANSHARIAVNDWDAGGLVANDLVGIRIPHPDAVSNRWVNLSFFHVGENGLPPGGSNIFSFFQSVAATNQSRFAGILSNTASPLHISTNWLGPNDFTNVNLRVQEGSPLIDSGVWLTTVVSSSGSGTTMSVADAGYFYDGWGIPGEMGDLVQLQGSTNRVRITSVDYAANTITLGGSISWTNGQGLSLAYEGASPDIGAFEYSSGEPGGGSGDGGASTQRARVSGRVAADGRLRL